MFDRAKLYDREFQKSLVSMIKEASDIAHDMQNMIGQSGFERSKIDKTPVTMADDAVEDFIKKSLQHLSGDIFFLGEESASDIIARKKKLPADFWICDPIDGTQGYAKGGPDYAITLAYISNKRPVFGLIALPHYREIIMTQSSDEVAFYDTHLDTHLDTHNVLKRVKDNHDKERLIVGPGRLNAAKIYEALFKKEPKSVIERASALKFVELVKNQADVYIRERQLCEWDVAAGDAIIHAFGGSMVNYKTNDVITYGHCDKSFYVEEIVVRA